MRSLLLLAAALAVSGCSQLYVQAEEQRLCDSLPQGELPTSFPGAPPQITHLDTPSFDLPLKDIISSFPTSGSDLTLHLKLLELDFIAKQGVTNFSGINQASLTTVPPGSTSQTPLVLLSYTKDPNAQPSATMALTAPPGGATDLMGIADSSNNINLVLSLDGTLPPQAWSTDLTACMAMTAKLKYADALAHHN